jgi:hypothetical protein
MTANTTPAQATSERSWEFVAIPMVLGILGGLALLMLAVTSGLAVWLTLGAIFTIAVVAVALLTMRRPSHPTPPSAGEIATAHLDDGVHRVLVIADDTCSPSELGAAVAAHAGDSRTAAYVIAPALGSRTARWTGDQHAYADAERHLDATLQALKDMHVDAVGHVGPHDPLQAADDGLREFPADEILFAVHPSGPANWLERGVVDDARSRYVLPVSELVVECSA